MGPNGQEVSLSHISPSIQSLEVSKESKIAFFDNEETGEGVRNRKIGLPAPLEESVVYILL